MTRRKMTHVVELTVTQTIVTERWGCGSSEMALNAVIADHCGAIPFFSDRPTREPGAVVIEKAVAYEHPTELPTLPEHCGANCLKFLTKERRVRLKELVRNQEYNMAAFGAWMVEHDPDWAVTDL